LSSFSRLAIVFVVFLGFLAPAALPAAPTATATFAGGCFWCEETAFVDVPGVLSVTSGFTGGQVKNPTYEMVSAGGTGHAESVQVVFDPAKISYERLLDIFWKNVDPTQANGQFCDHGNQYRSAIFYADESQKAMAEGSKKKVESLPQFQGKKIVTEVVPASTFYKAEEYHQQFYKKNPVRYHEYRTGCGRDARLRELWGAPAAGGHK
jgi:peptide-methionine (S)-S-oxide reductase